MPVITIDDGVAVFIEGPEEKMAGSISDHKRGYPGIGGPLDPPDDLEVSKTSGHLPGTS